MTAAHEEKETLSVDILVPEHADRVETQTFRRTRAALIKRDGGRCWISGMTAEQSGHPLEAHHFPIERCLAEMIDWNLVKTDALAGEFGVCQAQRDAAKEFDWSSFDPADPYSFVDNMLVNGLLLAKQFHIGKNKGVHTLPHPLWIAQRYGKEGYKFSEVEVIHHAS